MLLFSSKSFIAFTRTFTPLLIFLIPLLIMIHSCQQNKEPLYKVIHVQLSGDLGEDEGLLLQNFNRIYPSNFTAVRKNQGSALLVREGDLIMIGTDEGINYSNLDEDTLYLQMSEHEELIYINGEIASCRLGQNSDFPDSVLLALPNEKLKFIHDLSVEQNITKEQEAFLARLAEHGRLQSIQVEYNQDFLSYLSEAFEIKHLLLAVDSISDLSSLSDFQELEHLNLWIEEKGLRDTLPFLPKLRKLNIQLCSQIPQGFYSNNPQLEELFVSDVDKNQLQELVGLPKLKLLSIIASDSLFDLEPLSHLDKLEILSISTNMAGTKVNFNSIAKLDQLKWLATTALIDPNEFDQTLKQLPSLEVLQLYDGHDSLSLEFLSSLPHLRCLEITDTLADMESILELHELEYLSIPDGSYNDTLFMQKLKKALPETTIVPNAGLCMGSGWLLLVVPLIILFVILRIIVNKDERFRNDGFTQAE